MIDIILTFTFGLAAVGGVLLLIMRIRLNYILDELFRQMRVEDNYNEEISARGAKQEDGETKGG